MRISTGSILQFDVIFNIPVNTIFNKITITDPLVAGLSYDTVTQPAKIYIDDSTTPTTAGVTDTSTATNIELTLDDTIVGNLIAIKKIKASIPVVVANADTFLAAIAVDPTLKNIATIKAFDVTDTELSSTTAEAALNSFEPCNLFGFGSAYNVEKSPDKDLLLIANIPGIGSMETTELEYEVVITADSHLVPGAAGDIEVFIGNAEQTPVTPTEATIVGNVITIKFTHRQDMKNTTVYISVPAKTGANIVDVIENFVISTGTAKLVYTPAGGTATTVCTSPNFTITTDLTPAPPILSSAQKIIV